LFSCFSKSLSLTFKITTLMMAAKNLRLHTDTIFDGLLSDGFFVGLLILLFLAIIFLMYNYFRKK